jgi:hypothetical protein
MTAIIAKLNAMHKVNCGGSDDCVQITTPVFTSYEEAKEAGLTNEAFNKARENLRAADRAVAQAKGALFDAKKAVEAAKAEAAQDADTDADSDADSTNAPTDVEDNQVYDSDDDSDTDDSGNDDDDDL